MSSTTATTTAARTAGAERGTTFAARRQRERILRMALIALALIYALFPVAWIISASLNPANTLLGQGLIPENASLENYQRLLTNPTHPFGRWMFNSFYIAAITATLAVLVSSLSAYAFSRFRFRGRQGMLLTVFLVQVFPNALTMVATFLLLQQIGRYIPSLGLNSHGGLILVYLGGAMGINTWLMKGFYDSIPREVDESAMIDGATHWQIFWHILFPLVRPILAVVGILTFVGTYGDYIISLVVLKQPELYTLALGLSLFIGDTFSQNWGVFAAGALLGAIPIVVMYLVLQDYIVGGLTQGAVKG
jgi:ABC-type maltose transport system permease subunit